MNVAPTCCLRGVDLTDDGRGRVVILAPNLHAISA